MKRIFPLVICIACSKQVQKQQMPIAYDIIEPQTTRSIEKSESQDKKIPEIKPSTSDSSMFSEKINEIIESRIRSGKMGITKEQAARISLYMQDLKSEKIKQFSNSLPKASIELVRAINERGVQIEEAEKISEFLLFFLDSLKISYPQKFDENLSHVIGREWKDIDYSGEGMTWQKAKSIFEPMGVIDFRKAEYLEIYFKWECNQTYFKRIYRPQADCKIIN